MFTFSYDKMLIGVDVRQVVTKNYFCQASEIPV